jgi:hypothetical protein
MEVADAAADNGADSFEESPIPEAEEFDGLQTVEADEPEPQGDESLEDIEHDGKTYQVPKALKGAFLRQADYTRKTQELAAERRAVDEARQVDSAALNLRAGLVALEQKIAACQAVDWDRARLEDPEGAAQLEAHIGQLAAAHAELTENLGQTEAQRTQAEQQARLVQLHQGHAELSRDLPGWSAELAQRLARFAVTEFGVSEREVSQIDDPRMVKLLHAAYVGSNAGALTRGAQRHAAAQASRPAATVDGRATAGKNPNRMSTDEWMRHRNKQLRQLALN